MTKKDSQITVAWETVESSPDTEARLLAAFAMLFADEAIELPEEGLI